MFNNILKKIFGSRNDRLIKKYSLTIRKINELSDKYASMTDEQCRELTHEFKERVNQGCSLHTLLPDAFALVREVAERQIGQRHFDVQLIGGIALHEGNIAEMGTGEGKTLTATLPAYLNALSSQPVHIVTVNDYLAKRDAEWMGKIFQALGLSVGTIVPEQSHEEKISAYKCDIIYATNNELGFDYLRDNMAPEKAHQVQSPLSYAIIDEVDSILIDEARTPLIISGPIDSSAELYEKITTLIPSFVKDEDFTLQEKEKQILLTEKGHIKAENLMHEEGLLEENTTLYDLSNITLLHYLDACLRACHMYHKDVDYMIKDNQVVIIDAHTGRTLAGRRWSNGLHQAIEAKEKTAILAENQTLASITFQNFFRLYSKLAGMTGTADTEAQELHDIYKLEVVIIPPNKALARDDMPDMIFLNQNDKYTAIVKDIQERHSKGQPILVGTCSIESSEYLSHLLKSEGIKHSVLNAKHHDKEANIIAEAGQLGAVTIATNMAGRGTDIVLGGSQDTHPANSGSWQEQHEKVISSGGLHVLGTERNESRRVDNQLRGRAGRQGDHGSSQYYLSLEDNLMRIFASDRVTQLMQVFGMKKGDHIQAPMLNRAIENAQKKVESYHYDIRKQLLKFDDVANEQRNLIYDQRRELMITDDILGIADDIITTVVSRLVKKTVTEKTAECDMDELKEQVQQLCANEFDIDSWCREHPDYDANSLTQALVDWMREIRKKNYYSAPENVIIHTYRMLILSTLDKLWKEHLAAVDHLRQGINLRGYAQKDPAHEFRKESFQLFQEMLQQIQSIAAKTILHLIFQKEEKSPPTSSGYNIQMNL